jgi:ribonuclease-3
MELTALEERLGYSFAQRTLLEQAVTHRSHGAVHNERLEFLGDAVLNCAIAQLLFAKYARLDEGDLSRLRANLVKQQSLAEIAEKLVLSDFMRLGEGEMKSGGFRRPSILADTMEAIFGAIFVDTGFDAARQVIGKLFDPVLKTVDPKTLGKDSKTLLQEYLQSKRIALPVYTVVETRGAAHNQEFEVECSIPKLETSVRGTGRGGDPAHRHHQGGGVAAPVRGAGVAVGLAPDRRLTAAARQSERAGDRDPLPVHSFRSDRSVAVVRQLPGFDIGSRALPSPIRRPPVKVWVGPWSKRPKATGAPVLSSTVSFEAPVVIWYWP